MPVGPDVGKVRLKERNHLMFLFDCSGPQAVQEDTGLLLTYQDLNPE